jgi:hypothetical protein
LLPDVAFGNVGLEVETASRFKNARSLFRSN